MRSVGDMWPFMTAKKKRAALDAQHRQELFLRRAAVAARLKALEARHDEKMAELIEARQAVGRARQAQERNEPYYIINEEEELTDV